LGGTNKKTEKGKKTDTPPQRLGTNCGPTATMGGDFCMEARETPTKGGDGFVTENGAEGKNTARPP